MAGTRFAYVRNFELPDPLLPDTYLVCRLDGHSFHRFSDEHGFAKPNDERALQLMDHAAKSAMIKFKDIMLAFGESDEFSFLFRKSTNLYNRRQSKILTTLTSYFTSCYVLYWSLYFPDTPLRYPPPFDGRIVVYPTECAIRDYFSWRQADTHINNLYNTTFWALIQKGGQTTTEAHATLRCSFPERFKKGSVIVRDIVRPIGIHDEQNRAESTELRNFEDVFPYSTYLRRPWSALSEMWKGSICASRLLQR
ncbi:tRNAHis guanylyltransferase [Suillus plorans]|uniref:tRNA(His) guanylyltransferase n=1 Tax=Suillus plorans TaxID=116603 RepID=A0A9P7DMJ7_9AGAM|nr:tRNAHis guanylyltransferase [Suillus plorans]KAG1798508.1 tRNAHis guanylyltransferase [Suillus plorans]